MVVNPPRTGPVPTNEQMVAAELARIHAEAPGGRPPGAPIAAVAPLPAVVAPPPPKDLAAVQAARKEATARKRAATEARAAASADPAIQLAEEQLALAREQREAELEEHELEADRIYREACLLYGEDRVVRVETARGSIVLRPPTEPEADATLDRIMAHERARDGAKTKEEAKIHGRNAEEEARNGIRALVLTSAAHLEQVTRDHFALWTALGAAKTALVDGRRRDLGKAAAH